MLRIAAKMPNRRATTEQFIGAIPDLHQLSRLDLQRSKTRPLQPRWHQIVRNVISHRSLPAGPFATGLAERTPDGLAVTRKGITYLRRLGYRD